MRHNIAISKWIFTVVLVFQITSGMAAGTTTAATTPQQAFTDGTSAATSFNTANSNVINPNSTQSIPGYSGAPANADTLYGQGSGDITGAGTTQVQTCANSKGKSGTNDPYCNAVNFTVQNEPQNSQTSPQNVSNDPLVVNSNTLSKSQNATIAAAGSLDAGINATMSQLGINTSASTSACTTTSNTIPATYTNKTCTIMNPSVQQQCSTGRIIDVQTNTNYQCDQNKSNYVTNSCNKTLAVTFKNSCDPKTLPTVTYYPRIDGNSPHQVAFGGTTGTTAVGPDQITVTSGCGGSGSGTNATVPISIDAYGERGGGGPILVNIPQHISSVVWGADLSNQPALLLGVVTPNWEGAIREIRVYLEPDSKGCDSAGNCSYNLYWDELYGATYFIKVTHINNGVASITINGVYSGPIQISGYNYGDACSIPGFYDCQVSNGCYDGGPFWGEICYVRAALLNSYPPHAITESLFPAQALVSTPVATKVDGCTALEALTK